MNDNLATIRSGCAGRPGVSTILAAVRWDMQHKLCFRDTRNRKGVSFGILWLLRALRFVINLVSNLGGRAELYPDANDALSRDRGQPLLAPGPSCSLCAVLAVHSAQPPDTSKQGDQSVRR